ncbi:hypothetical protein SADUNF_Sadunf02G0132900 [Salix dunnii]|uniref:Uncharacterized protein n=1 Tax=Salix dunnii TaxID=1413687 RepID=A0A835N7Z1_9ROSI|nr:hypothetical protein SADUNF_Sadunf02G0132900 [Salix dunnii]
MLSSGTTRSPEKPESKFEDEEEAGELEQLDTQVKHMAKKILEYRATLLDQLKTTVASLLSSQRPILPECDSGSDTGPPGELNPDSGQDKSSRAALLTKEDQETAEKVHLMKEKISSYVSTMPVVLKRMRDCISRINKLDSYSGSMHPALKKKKTS